VPVFCSITTVGLVLMSKENKVNLGVQARLDKQLALLHERPISWPTGFRAGA